MADIGALWVLLSMEAPTRLVHLDHQIGDREAGFGRLHALAAQRASRGPERVGDHRATHSRPASTASSIVRRSRLKSNGLCRFYMAPASIICRRAMSSSASPLSMTIESELSSARNFASSLSPVVSGR